MKNIIGYLAKQSVAFLTLSGVVYLLLLAIVDYLTGMMISLLIFYLVPIFGVTWFIGKWSGVLMSVAATIAWVGANVADMRSSFSFGILYWNAFMRLSFFLVNTYILTALKGALEKEKTLARIDPLTQIANRRQFFESSEVEISRARRFGRPISAAYLDVDNFKSINDRFGHESGDNLLRLIADTVVSAVRGIDLVARLGGDEFAILMPETGPEAARLTLRRVQINILNAVRRAKWDVTFSIGVATFVTPPNSVEQMIRAVDDLMYSVKGKGKNSVEYRVVDDGVDIAINQV